MSMMLVQAIVEEAARIVCGEALTDYRAAKLKALQRLGLPRSTALPENRLVDAAVIDYLRLFGGEAYRQRLQKMRALAPPVMRQFSAFEPRLTGGVVSGALTASHHLQIHLFAEQAELLDLFLIDRGIEFEVLERRYRYASGIEQAVPLLRFERAGLGIDLSVFTLDDLRRAPLNPNDGLPYQRLGLAKAEALTAAGA
jgi:hypothetical protein